MAAWYEDDAFWETLGPHLFRPAEWAAATAQVDAMIRLVGLAQGMRVLDIPCGPGRHAVELARRGMLVTGVDRTQAYLDEAGRQAARAGVTLDLVREDMRAFRREAAFDAIVCLSNSFSYFEDAADDRRFIGHVRCSLAAPGVFVLELGWLGREIVTRNFRMQGREWQELDGGGFLLQEMTIDPLWRTMDNRWVLLRGADRREFRFSQRLYGAGELDALLRGCGFAQVDVYGSLGGRPYDHRALALVAVART